MARLSIVNLAGEGGFTSRICYQANFRRVGIGYFLKEHPNTAFSRNETEHESGYTAEWHVDARHVNGWHLLEALRCIHDRLTAIDYCINNAIISVQEQNTYAETQGKR
jgi:hypothetical protein